MTTAVLLTPPCTGAIAVIAVNGPDAWRIAKSLFSKPLPQEMPAGRFWFGQCAGDDVILAAINPETVEIHCHGGHRVVDVILAHFKHAGCDESPYSQVTVWKLIGEARTLRTANILLDQAHGAFGSVVQRILDHPQLEGLASLAAVAPIGLHLVTLWSVAIAGAPNVGKSSLLNALAGFERAVVSPVAGTTRDSVTLTAAFDGWPVELTDTAGVRTTADELESAGIERARAVTRQADVVVWVLDASTAPIWPDGGEREPDVIVANKCDLPGIVIPPSAIGVSARTGEGLAALIAAIVRRIVPVAPAPGDAVPYAPELAAAVTRAHAFARTGNLTAAREVLATCLFPPV